jgi:uncharacterized protein
MQFDWDEAKNQANVHKHGIDFAKVPEMFDQEMLVELDGRVDYGEERWVGTGFLKSNIAVVVWTERWGDVIWIISARRATSYERERFEQYLSGGF